MRPTPHPSSFRLVWLFLLAGLLAACGVPDSGALPATPIANPPILPLSTDAGAMPTILPATPTFPPPTPDTRTDNANPTELTDVAGTLYFTAYGEPGGYRLWKSDGTADGTILAADLFPGETNWYPAALTNVGGVLFFATYSDQRGHQAWKLDGTTPTPLDSLPPFYYSAGMRELAFFFGRQLDGRWELWKSDGATPTHITDLNSTMDLSDMEISGETLFFMVGDAIMGHELWRSDGTANGTALVKGGQGWTLRPNLTDVHGTLFFSAADERSGHELWKIDPASGEPALVIDLAPGPRSSNPSTLLNVDGTLYFAAYTGGDGWELWKSDGTANGTTRIKDGLGATPVPYLAHIGGTLFFNAYDPASGWELWRSDGTANGTILVKDISPGPPDSQPEQLTSVGGALFFTAYTEEYGRELWKSDGTADGTMLVKDLNLKPSPAGTPGPMPTPSIGFIP